MPRPASLTESRCSATPLQLLLQPVQLLAPAITLTMVVNPCSALRTLVHWAASAPPPFHRRPHCSLLRAAGPISPSQ